MLLVEQLNLIQKVDDSLKSATGKAADSVYEKFSYVIEKNSGFKTISAICSILNGETDSVGIDFTPVQVSGLKYAPITSCDVERSFSRYKAVMRDNRQSFKPENISMYMVSHCNGEILSDDF